MTGLYFGRRVAASRLLLVGIATLALGTPLLGKAAKPRSDAARRVSYPEMVERVIIADSDSWLFKVYQKGSVRDVTVRKGELPGNILVDATYGYENGSRTSITVLVHNGQVDCVEFGDEPLSGCRPVGYNMLVDVYAGTRLTPEQRQREEAAKARAKEQECNFDPRYC